MARPGAARRGVARLGEARLGTAWRGKARQGEAMLSAIVIGTVPLRRGVAEWKGGQDGQRVCNASAMEAFRNR
jgi:hypothetical protein